MCTKAELFLPRVHMLRKDPRVSASLITWGWETRVCLIGQLITAHTFFCSPRPPADSQKPSCSLACRFREIRAPQQGLPLCASLGWEMEMSLSICLWGHSEGALGEMWAQVSLTAGEAYDSELISNSTRSGKIQHLYHDRSAVMFCKWFGVLEPRTFLRLMTTLLTQTRWFRFCSWLTSIKRRDVSKTIQTALSDIRT